MGSPRLRQVFAQIDSALQRGMLPLVVFDLDSTLFSTALDARRKRASGDHDVAFDSEWLFRSPSPTASSRLLSLPVTPFVSLPVASCRL